MSAPRWLAALVALAAVAPRSAASSQATLRVTVTDSAGIAVHGAQIAVAPLGVGGRTDVTGQVALTSLPNGTYLVTARRFGFLPDSQRV